MSLSFHSKASILGFTKHTPLAMELVEQAKNASLS
jgi:hypothetical protein